MSVYLCLKCGRFYPTVNAMKACAHKDKVEAIEVEKPKPTRKRKPTKVES